MVRRIVFLGDPTYPSTLMRGNQIAETLVTWRHDARTVSSPVGIYNSVVVLIKYTLGHAKVLKAQGNIVLYDVVDALCKPGGLERILSFQEFLDGVIVSNKASLGLLKSASSHLAKLPMVVVYHHWDPRIPYVGPGKKFVLSYVGDYGSLPFGLENASALARVQPFRVLDTNAGSDRTEEFTKTGRIDTPPLDAKNNMVAIARLHSELGVSCHIGARALGSADALYKPGVKLATAAALGCNFITTPDASTVELLGAHYPYLARSSSVEDLDAVIRFAQQTFGTSVWWAALEQMTSVRRLTSIGNVAAGYLDFLKQFG